jgi:hypothetical protein
VNLVTPSAPTSIAAPVAVTETDEPTVSPSVPVSEVCSAAWDHTEPARVNS